MLIRTLFLFAALWMQGVPTTVYVATYSDVQPTAAAQGATLLKEYIQGARTSPGFVGGDVYQEIGRPNRFVTIEEWKDQAAFDGNEKAARTTQFRAKLKQIHRSPYDQRVMHGYSVQTPLTAVGSGTVVIVTHVDVPPPNLPNTETLLRGLVDDARKDAGNVRFEVFQQDAPRTNHFTTFAVWKDKRAFDANAATPGWLRFREGMGPLLGALYDERVYAPLK